MNVKFELEKKTNSKIDFKWLEFELWINHSWTSIYVISSIRFNARGENTVKSPKAITKHYGATALRFILIAIAKNFFTYADVSQVQKVFHNFSLFSPDHFGVIQQAKKKQTNMTHSSWRCFLRNKIKFIRIRKQTKKNNKPKSHIRFESRKIEKSDDDISTFEYIQS